MTAPAGDAATDTQAAPQADPRNDALREAAASATAVPHQTRRPPAGATGPDPLEDADPRAAADAAGTENLLRCWVRETGAAPGEDGTLRLPLTALGSELVVTVRYWSPTGHHRFGAARLGAGDGSALDAVTLAALLTREPGSPPGPAAPGTAPATADRPTGASPAGAAVSPQAAAARGPVLAGADLVARVADSVRRTAVFLTHRRARPETPAGTSPFLDAEQALVLGHPLHPTPKGREGLSEAEAETYSPELRGAYPLHWMAVHRDVLATDSAWTEGGRPVGADRLLARLAGTGDPEGGVPRGAAGAVLPPGTAPLPLHPWQAAEIRHRPAVRRLLEQGLLQDLGPLGAPWHPTSSVRTVYRADAPAMLKLSLGLAITNSRRENLRKELHRGVEVHRLLRSGLARRWQAAHPGFDIVRDPAWLGVDSGEDGSPLPGLDVVIRHNPFGPGDDVSCVAGLAAPRPWPGLPAPALRSRLAQLVGRLAARTGRPPAAVTAEWFLRYLDAVIRPVLWLDGEAGIALEAHQQNTLVVLDADGWPTGGRYRDNQGYYFRESHRPELEKALPGIGAESDTFVADEVADERIAYYVGINNVLGLIGAIGAQHLADERVLLAAFRRFLGQAAANGRSALPGRLLSAPELRCKANLLTRLHGMDELVGPVDTQSVYVTIPNPLAGAGAV
jgi:siderophore synthetase component